MPLKPHGFLAFCAGRCMAEALGEGAAPRPPGMRARPAFGSPCTRQRRHPHLLSCYTDYSFLGPCSCGRRWRPPSCPRLGPGRVARPRRTLPRRRPPDARPAPLHVMSTASPGAARRPASHLKEATVSHRRRCRSSSSGGDRHELAGARSLTVAARRGDRSRRWSRRSSLPVADRGCHLRQQRAIDVISNSSAPSLSSLTVARHGFRSESRQPPTQRARASGGSRRQTNARSAAAPPGRPLRRACSAAAPPRP